MKRSNQYEAAFEAYLQEQRLCYVAVDETRRSLFDDAPLKSLDFLVFSEGGARLVIDVKGRRFPAGPRAKRRWVWECWSTRDDIDGLGRWADLAGPGYRGLLVFAYYLLPEANLPDTLDDLGAFRGRRYLLRAVAVDDYREHMRVRSPRWDTVTLPKDAFRSLVRPVRHFTRAVPATQECPF